VILTQEEVELLKELKAAGGRGRTAWQCPYQCVGIVGASRSDTCHVVLPGTSSRRRLDDCARLDGLGVYFECEIAKSPGYRRETDQCSNGRIFAEPESSAASGFICRTKRATTGGQ
jgi:hypothetical protein